MGDLTYAIYYLAVQWAERQPSSFHRLNETHGVFHSAAAEFYHRKLRPHEDRALERNGEAC